MDGDKAGLAFDRAPLRAKRGGGGCGGVGRERQSKRKREGKTRLSFSKRT